MSKAPGQMGMSAVRYRGLKGSSVNQVALQSGRSAIFGARKGDLISIHNVDGAAKIAVSSFAENEATPSGTALGLPTGTPHNNIAAERLSDQIRQPIWSRDGDPADIGWHVLFDDETQAGDVFTLKMSADARFIAHAPCANNYLENGGGGLFHIDHQPAADRNDQPLPEPLGKIRDEFRVHRASARSYEVRRGEVIQIIDVEGQQCSDFMAMRSDALDAGLERHIDSTVSRTMIRGAYPLPGLHDKFFDQDFIPLLSVRKDTVGRHDTFALACTARGYEERGFPGHINCSDNISNAYDRFGIKRRRAWPAINFFFNSWMDAENNQLASDEAWSRAGDFVAMEALTDLVCVSTACPDDVDPINGWNPTDIHVRIYEPNQSIQHAVAFRNQPDEPLRMTRQSPFHSRTSKLTKTFAVAQDVWLPSHYEATGAIAEYWACKEAATLQDMSSLRKYDIMGPDAEELLQICMTRNIGKLAEHRGLYTLICDERGQVIDDGTLFRLEANVYRWCCGSENSALHLREEAEKRGLRVWIKSLTEQMANLALQGPKSRQILEDLVFIQPTRPALENVKWFGFTHARIKDRFGPLFMLTRTGFTGELGYEIFCDADNAEAIWDALIEAGAPHGLKPMGGTALNMLRTEAGLMTAGAEFTADNDAMEAGLGFAVDMKKTDFIGRQALERNAGAERRRLVGLLFNSNEHCAHGDPVYLGRQQVGTVTSSCPSPQLGAAIAMARVAIENCEIGESLEVGRLDGLAKRLPCTVTSIPFIDAKREKPRA